jgi:hypothetical protein
LSPFDPALTFSFDRGISSTNQIAIDRLLYLKSSSDDDPNAHWKFFVVILKEEFFAFSTEQGFHTIIAFSFESQVATKEYDLNDSYDYSKCYQRCSFGTGNCYYSTHSKRFFLHVTFAKQLSRSDHDFGF